MPNIPISISNLQSRNIDRINEPVESAGVGSDFQGNATDFTPLTTTVVQKPKEEIIFETVLPEVQRELIVRYDNNLTNVSNYSYVHDRDAAGNIIFTENATDNQLLLIEPVTYRFETEFINNTINTRFSYFRFPATSIASIDVPQLNSIDSKFNSAISELSVYAQNETDQITGAGLFDNFDQSIRGVVDPEFAADIASNAIDAAPFSDVYQTSGNLMQSANIGQG